MKPVSRMVVSSTVALTFSRSKLCRMSKENAVQWLIDNPVETGPEADSEPAQGVATTSIEAEVVKDKGAEENNQVGSHVIR